MPRFAYKCRMKVDKLLTKYPELLVVRLVEGELSQYRSLTIGGVPELSDKVFKNSMANLSLNLAGGLFNVSPDGHLPYLPDKSIVKSWNGLWRKKSLCSKTGSYKASEECFGLCFHTKDVHDRTFPYYKHFDTQQERDEYAKEVGQTLADAAIFGEDVKCVGAFKSKKENVLVYPRIRIHHAPTNANYWHATLDTYRPTDNTYIRSEDVESRDKKMFKALKHDLIEKCSINEAPTYCIDKVDYYKTPFYYIGAFCMKIKRLTV